MKTSISAAAGLPAGAGRDGLLELVVSDVAHGGWCVARHPDGRVVFVRHALPGERVRARITDTTARFARELDCPTPLFAATSALYNAAMAQGFAESDTAAVCAVLERSAGIRRRD